jgi:RHS repeat-associated protein
MSSASGSGVQPSKTTTLWANNQENETAFAYDSAITFHDPYWTSGTQFSTHYSETFSGSYGLVESKKDYDYGSGAPSTTVLRTTSTTYEALSNSNYLSNNFLNLQLTVAVTGSGPGSSTTYAYDENNGSPQGVLGNLTSIHRWLNSPSSYLVTANVYNSNGLVTSSTDPKSNSTGYGYAPSSCPANSGFAGSGPTSVTNAAGQTTYNCYDLHTGLLVSTKDPNSQTTSYAYDDMLRTTQINYPDTGQTSFGYTSAYQGGAYTLITEKRDTSGDSRVSYVWVDGLGREGRVAVASGETLYYDETLDICYDGVGRISFQGYPFQDNGWSADRSCSIAGDTFAYDGLSRNTKVTHTDGSAISTSYLGNSATVTDEQSKTREGFVDGLGRLEEVIENPSGLNFVTTYGYDALNDLTSVTEDGSRQRTYVYDSLSRLTSSTNPETGTTPVAYTYDADSNVLTKTDTRSITSTFAYDALSRITSKTYSDGTPTAYYYYDQTAWQGIPLTNTVGRLAYQGTYSTQWLTSSGFSYDPVGRVTNNSQCIIPACPSGPLSVTYGYDLIGDMTSYTNPAGHMFVQSFNAAGRVNQLTSSWSDSQHPATLVSGVHYNAMSYVTAATLGNGLTKTSAYNGLLQRCRVNLNSSGTALSSCTVAVPSGNVLDLNYGFNYGSGDNGNVMSFSAVGAQTFSRSYTYDALNRIYTMSAPGDQCTGLQWTIDPWGNRTNQTATGGTCDAFSQLIGTNNRLSSSPYQYDAMGNLLFDGVHHYAYDAEDRISTVDSASTANYVYDAEGRRADKTTGATTTYYIYDLSGHVISEYSCQTCWTVSYVQLNDQLAAIYESGTTYFTDADQLGSTRLVTTYPTPSVAECDDYYPYGELIACGSTTITTHKFTGYQLDSETGLNNAQARYYGASMGRFMSPDPAGLSSVDLSNPQSWNFYAYVYSRPLVLTDSTGLDPCDDDPTCDPGTGNGYGYGTYPELSADPDPQQAAGQSPRTIHSDTYHPFPPDPDLCPTSSQACSQELRRIRDGLNWWGTAAKSFFSPRQMVTSTIKSFGEGGCNRLMVDTIGEDMVGLPNSLGARDFADNAEGAAFLAGVTRAAGYSVSKGLVVPLRSTTYKAIRATATEGAEVAGKYAVPALVAYSTADAVISAAVAGAKGQCH